MITPSIRLQIQKVSKRFGGVQALRDVSLDAHSGEIHAICGENGAGKSTLMKILSGAITSYEGTVLLHGEQIEFRGPRDAEEAGVSIIYQELNLVPDLSAAANIFLGREKSFAGIFMNDREMERESAEFFRRLGAQFSPRTKVRDLRIGDQQLVEIAKALSLEADIMIMDEPTSALAEGEVERLFDVIRTLKEHGVTLLYISHKMDEVFRVADRITVMRDGAHVITKRREETSAREIIQCMVGREIAAMTPLEVAEPGEIILQVQGLTLPHRTLEDRFHLKDVDLTVRRGEVVGVAGLLGAGRTELLESLFGVSHVPPSGSIRLEGKEVRVSSPTDAIDFGLALVTEDRKTLGLFDQMTVRENITISSLEDSSWGPFIRGASERKRAKESIGRLAIKTDSPESSITSLSGGNQQKAIIARCLLTNPRLLLLDEPTRGIDVGAKSEIYALLRRLCDQGLGIIMTSSELPELLAVSDRIIVLCEGRKTAEFSRSEATEERMMHAATAFATVGASR